MVTSNRSKFARFNIHFKLLTPITTNDAKKWLFQSLYFLAYDGSVRFFLNYFFNGNACVGMQLISRIIVMNDISLHMISKMNGFTECPAGLFGRNCSALCPYPFYGVRCNETCTCSNSSCHHAYGCTTTTLSSAGMYNYVVMVKSISVP